ncbi:hypothetical protein EDF46_0022 [Frondihabitans sp. PhB188]|uniref:hypothetical protein n=1 Tax=Frondihabitans sp. PhB188 TaxID=2485200 RepID=UPI000F49051F|nr:hypothetical protein [Frondihabitans sp. PhB188]ROQ40664.1 hypothetical protein EDF46_0022 [Frondihabitans sp. PhB188]
MRATHVKPATTVIAVAILSSCALALTGCSTGYPSIEGVWRASDGSANKTVSDDGNCTNMLYKGATMIEIAKPGMCHITGSDGTGYTLEVEQGGTTVDYTATFSKNDSTMTLSRVGDDFVTLTRVPSAH